MKKNAILFRRNLFFTHFSFYFQTHFWKYNFIFLRRKNLSIYFFDVQKNYF